MTKLWLLVEDVGSYSPDKLETIWGKAAFDGPNGRTELAELKPVDGSGLRQVAVASEPSADGVRVKTPSRLVYDIAGKGSRGFTGWPASRIRSITSDLNPRLRFMVFDREPDMERLTPVRMGVHCLRRRSLRLRRMWWSGCSAMLWAVRLPRRNWMSPNRHCSIRRIRIGYRRKDWPICCGRF